MQVKKLLVLLLIVYLSSPAFAATLAESALKDTFGVRPMGMGGAFVAAADDANSIFYNPAGLGDLPAQYLMGYLDQQQAESQNYTYQLLAGSSLGWGTWHKSTLSGENVEVTAYGFGAKGMNLAWGATYKVVRGNISNNVSEGYSVDAGALYRFSPDLVSGILIQDLAENIGVAATLRVGVNYFLTEYRASLVSDLEIRDLRSPKGADIYPHFGAESRVTDNLILRTGWEKGNYTFGVTAQFPYFTLDYAVSSPLDTSSNPSLHRFGFRVGGIE